MTFIIGDGLQMTGRTPSRNCSVSDASCSGRSRPTTCIQMRAHKALVPRNRSNSACTWRQPQLYAGHSLSCKPVCGPGSLEMEHQGRSTVFNNLAAPTTAMARLGGSSGGVTIERSKLDLRQKIQTVEPKLSNDGGGGGIGNKIFNGGGGDGDDGDDDDYFNFEDGDGDGDEGFWRTTIQELYDEASIKAVLQEWFRSFSDLPAIISQSVQLGLFSSAQLVRFLSMDVRPNITRQVTRSLPPKAARGIVGRLMADPAFMQKLLIEQLITVGLSLTYEVQQRGDNFIRELDFVALNTLSLMGATGAMVWLVAPSRSYGAVHKFPWQNMLHNLPNHVFDASTPYRRFSIASRIGSLFAKAAELCAVGSLTGAAQSLGGAGLVRLHKLRDPNFQPSLAPPQLVRSSGGLAAYMGTIANLRYQAVSGMDRLLFDRMKVMLLYLGFSSILRTGSQVFGHTTRVFAQGLPTAAPRREPNQRLKPEQPVKKIIRRKVKKRPATSPEMEDEFELSGQMLRMQQLREQHRRRQGALA